MWLPSSNDKSSRYRASGHQLSNKGSDIFSIYHQNSDVTVEPRTHGLDHLRAGESKGLDKGVGEGHRVC